MINYQYLMRAAGLAVLPEHGAWVTIKGCPAWPRGLRLIQSHRQIGIQHMDIYWGCKEEMTFTPTVSYRRRKIPLPEAIYRDIAQGATEQQAVARGVEEIRDHIRSSPFRSLHRQQTLITISHPHHEEVRFYNSEVATYTAETIRLLLQEDCLEVMPFGQTQIPVLEDVTRELVDALRVDGLSRAEAYQEILATGINPDMQTMVPQRFYRPRGWYRDRFCEEST